MEPKTVTFVESSKKHLLELDAEGNINYSAYDRDEHTSPRCVKCGRVSKTMSEGEQWITEEECENEHFTDTEGRIFVELKR